MSSPLTSVTSATHSSNSSPSGPTMPKNSLSEKTVSIAHSSLSTRTEAPSALQYRSLQWLQGHYEGQTLNGSPHGHGQEYYITYCKDDKGEWKKRHSLVYNGEWKDGWRHGSGHEYTNIWQKDRGKWIEKSYLLYEGEWKFGFRHGDGKAHQIRYIKDFNQENKWTAFSTPLYQGLWKKGLFHVEGKMVPLRAIDGSTYNKYLPAGMLFFKEQGVFPRYIGGFLEGLFHDFGDSYNSSGNLEYTGYWFKGQYHGLGTLYYEFGTYSGSFEKGMKHGKGHWRTSYLIEVEYVYDSGTTSNGDKIDSLGKPIQANEEKKSINVSTNPKDNL